MNKKDKYIFPAIFSVDQDGISVEFPDLPGCLTCGDSEEEAFYMAKDALELHLFGLEEDGDQIPKPSKVSLLKLDKDQFIALIEVWMPPIRDEMASKSIKKTLTIPKWLNDLAEEKKVNFSQVLQNALLAYLGLNNNKNKCLRDSSEVVFTNYITNSKVAARATELSKTKKRIKHDVLQAKKDVKSGRIREFSNLDEFMKGLDND